MYGTYEYLPVHSKRRMYLKNTKLWPPWNWLLPPSLPPAPTHPEYQSLSYPLSSPFCNKLPVYNNGNNGFDVLWIRVQYLFLSTIALVHYTPPPPSLPPPTHMPQLKPYRLQNAQNASKMMLILPSNSSKLKYFRTNPLPEVSRNA
jgi:hypothetical protein